MSRGSGSLLRALRIASTMEPGRLVKRALYEAARRGGWLRTRYPRRGLDRWCLPDATAVLARMRAGTGFFFGAEPDALAEAYEEHFAERRASLVERADRVVAGEMPYFFDRWHAFDGPPDWFLNPFTGEEVSADRHWTELRFFSPEYGDLKFMLEPARFTVAFVLGRAYRVTADERYAARFWLLVEDWLEKNPPQAGPGWLCGQEASFRLLAWCFGLHAVARSEHTTLSRAATLIALIGAHADRIAGTVAYARAQKNNHALSEGAALLTAGLLFPEFLAAPRWRRQGRGLLEDETRAQLYGDGSYVQHSVNYHRVMLHDLLWSLRLSEVHGAPLTPEVYRRTELGMEWLLQLTDAGGRAPNLGANDGTLVLPLDECGYDDFRPTLQAVHFLLRGRPLLEAGPWDEPLLWLFGPRALDTGHVEASTGCVEASTARTDADGAGQEAGGSAGDPVGVAAEGVGEPDPAAPGADGGGGHPKPEGDGAATAERSGHDVVVPTRRSSRSFPVGGYYTLRGGGTWGVLRCASYGDRPAQADQLHLDVWWRGENVLCDAGTYLYNATGVWDNGLASTLVHNTVAVDGREQMTRASRFQWVDWAEGRVLRRTTGRGLEYLEAEHDGYADRGITHRRAVLLADGVAWVVVDDLLGTGHHLATLHWLVPNLEHRALASGGGITLSTEAGPLQLRVASSATATVERVRGGEGVDAATDRAADRIRGWRAPRYGRKLPALSLVARAEAEAPIRFVTVLAPDACELDMERVDGEVVVRSRGERIRVGLRPAKAGRAPVTAVRRSGGGETVELSVDPE